MAGFDQDVMYASNVDFTGSYPVIGQINLNGELLVGATVAPFIRSYVPTGSNGVVITTGPGTLDFSLANVPNSSLQNSSINVIAGTGLSGGGVVNLGGTITLNATASGTVTSVSGTLNRITSTGGTTPVIDISASYVGQSSITTLGTIGSGTWNGSVITGTYGGTGVNNGSSTITLGGSLTTSGAFATTFTMTGATNVTFPTSGTLSTSTGTVTSVSGTANQVSVATGTTTPVISLVGPYTPATYTAHGVLIGEGTSSIVALAAGSAGQVLQSGGASANPTYSTATYPATAGTSGNVLTSDGTNWTSAAAPGAGLVSTGTITLTNAQCKALATTPVTVIAAQGAGKVIIPISIAGKMNYAGTNQFNGTASLNFKYVDGSGVAVTSGFMGQSQINAAASSYSIGFPIITTTNSAITNFENQLLCITNSGGAIGGNAANDNTITIQVTYIVITL